MALLIEHPSGREHERRYIFDVLVGDFLGLEYATRVHEHPTTTIGPADDPAPPLAMPDLFLSQPPERWLTPESLPTLPLELYEVPTKLRQASDLLPPTVPILFGSSFNEHDLPIDIFGSAFFMLARYEELVTKQRDEHDRFSATHSVTAELAEMPIVNLYLELLWAALRSTWPGLRRTTRAYRFLPTHDVDEPGYLNRSWPTALREAAGDIARRREPALAIRRLRAHVAVRRTGRPAPGDPHDTFDFLMDASERAGVQSTFNLFGGRSNALYDASYDVGSPWMKDILRGITRRGHAVGLHPSYETYRDPARLQSEFAALKTVCEQENVVQETWGGRQHYLRWENPTTWRSWDEAGLDYDSSLGFADRIGFRTGCCYEYATFDVPASRMLRLRERPLIAMEGSLLLHMGCTLDQTTERLHQIMRVCRRYGGDFVLLWHNHMLDTKKARDAYAAVSQLAGG